MTAVILLRRDSWSTTRAAALKAPSNYIALLSYINFYILRGKIEKNDPWKNSTYTGEKRLILPWIADFTLDSPLPDNQVRFSRL